MYTFIHEHKLFSFIWPNNAKCAAAAINIIIIIIIIIVNVVNIAVVVMP